MVLDETTSGPSEFFEPPPAGGYKTTPDPSMVTDGELRDRPVS